MSRLGHGALNRWLRSASTVLFLQSAMQSSMRRGFAFIARRIRRTEFWRRCAARASDQASGSGKQKKGAPDWRSLLFLLEYFLSAHSAVADRLANASAIPTITCTAFSMDWMTMYSKGPW